MPPNKYSRFTAPAKKSSYPQDCGHVATIILGAAPSKKMRTIGSRSIILLSNGKLLIEHQTDVLSSVFQNSEITLVGGVDYNKVIDKIPPNTRFIVNHRYTETTAVYSVLLGLLATNKKAALIINGDLIFNEELFRGIIGDQSLILTDNKGNIGEQEVGVVIQDQYVTHLTYGVFPKWAQTIFLVGKELELLKTVSKDPYYHRLLLFEIINKIIDSGGKFRTFENPAGVVKEIDTHKQLNEAKTLNTNNELYASTASTN